MGYGLFERLLLGSRELSQRHKTSLQGLNHMESMWIRQAGLGPGTYWCFCN